MIQRYEVLSRIPSHIYKSQYGDIEYFLSGEGPPVLVSHGITGGVDQGVGLSKDYLGDGYQFLFISRFGYLQSSKPDNASPKLQAQVYKKLVDHLKLKKVFVFGNSAGSTSAIHFAINYPETCSGLILVSPNAPMDTPSGHPPIFVFKFNFLYWLMMKLFGKTMLKMFVPKPVLRDLSRHEISQLMEGIYFSALPVSQRTEGIMFDLFVSNPSINGNLSLEKIESPTLIINAVDDPATLIEGAKTLTRRIKNSELQTFSTGGHLLLGHKEEIKQKISEFILNHNKT